MYLWLFLKEARKICIFSSKKSGKISFLRENDKQNPKANHNSQHLHIRLHILAVGLAHVKGLP